jgi:type IV secretion system protein VirB4
MLRTDNITKDWKEAGSFPAQINLYGFWDEHCFLTKSGDLGTALHIGGIDYESLDHAGRDHAVKRLEAAFRSLDEKCRVYQILFKHNQPAIPHAEYENPLVRAAVEQRAAFLESKADRLYSIEIDWVVMAEGSYAKTGLLHALAALPKQPSKSLRDLHALFSGNKERTLIYEQIERDRLRLQQRVNSLRGQLSDLTTVELLGAERTFRLVRRLVNFRPSKIDTAPLAGSRHLDWQVCDSELEAHRGYPGALPAGQADAGAECHGRWANTNSHRCALDRGRSGGGEPVDLDRFDSGIEGRHVAGGSGRRSLVFNGGDGLEHQAECR